MNYSISLTLVAIASMMTTTAGDCFPGPSTIQEQWNTGFSSSNVVRLVPLGEEIRDSGCENGFVYDPDQGYITTSEFRVYKVAEVFRSDESPSLAVDDEIFVTYSTDTGTRVDMPDRIVGSSESAGYEGFLAFMGTPSCADTESPVYSLSECTFLHGPWSEVSAEDQAFLRSSPEKTPLLQPSGGLQPPLLPLLPPPEVEPVQLTPLELEPVELAPVEPEPVVESSTTDWKVRYAWFDAYRKEYKKGVKLCWFLYNPSSSLYNPEPQDGDKCTSKNGRITENYFCGMGEQVCTSSTVVPEATSHPATYCECNVVTEEFSCETWTPCDA